MSENLSLFDDPPAAGTQGALLTCPADPPLIDDGGHGRPAGAAGKPTRPILLENRRPAAVDLNGTGEAIGPIVLRHLSTVGLGTNEKRIDLGDEPGWVWLHWAGERYQAATLYSFARSRRDPAGYMLQR